MYALKHLECGMLTRPPVAAFSGVQVTPSKLVIDPAQFSQLDGTTTYTFTVTVSGTAQADTRTASASIAISPKPGNPPTGLWLP